MKSSPVTHFEMPAEDNKRAKEFYESTFGWKMQQLGEEMGNYLLAQTAETDNKNMVKTPGVINGGFFKKGEYGTSPHVVIAVENLEDHMKLVKQHGGKIQGNPQDIPEIGKFVMFLDTEGNRVCMLQPLQMNS
ncbi:MAG: VOC family protein [Nanoarchaeota archaeon]